MNGRSVRFRYGLSFLVLVLAVTLVEAIGTRVIRYLWEGGPTLPVVHSSLLGAVLSIVVFALVWAILDREGVTIRDIGLAPRLLLPALGAVAGYFVALNAVAAGFAIASGNAHTLGYHWTVSPAVAVVTFLWMLIIAGLVEEFIFRGYIQTKCVALLGDDRRTTIGLGIIVTGVLFSAYHIPRIMAGGTPAGMGPADYLALLAVNGIAFGLLYELTHNLFIPILIHAAGNMPGTAGILFFTTAGWPTWAMFGYQLAYLGLFIGLLLAYRRWGVTAGWMPVWSERRIARS